MRCFIRFEAIPVACGSTVNVGHLDAVQQPPLELTLSVINALLDGEKFAQSAFEDVPATKRLPTVRGSCS